MSRHFIESNIGTILKTKRKEKKIKAKVMAEKLGITYQHVWHIEGMKANLLMDVFIKMCDILDEKPSDILKEAGL